jgi:hypothetical protein
MRGFIEVTLKDDNPNAKQIVNLTHVRRVLTQGRGDRLVTMLELAGDGVRMIVSDTYAALAAAIEKADVDPQYEKVIDSYREAAEAHVGTTKKGKV